MSKAQQERLKNAECHYNGMQDEKGLDLLRECVKSILDEQRTTNIKKRRLKRIIERKER